MLLDPSNTYFINNYMMIIITLTLSGRSVHVIEMSFFQGAIFFLRKVCFYRKWERKIWDSLMLVLVQFWVSDLKCTLYYNLRIK